MTHDPGAEHRPTVVPGDFGCEPPGNSIEKAPWFAADERLREAAIDETLRHAMLGETVPSAAAQRAWATYWAGRAP